MTSQGRHRTVGRTEALPFLWVDAAVYRTVNQAIDELQWKGYEVRAIRLRFERHGQKVTVVLHLAPAPKQGISNRGQYSAQSVGKTARRNIETLLDYVRGLPDVRQADRQVDPASGGQDLHQDPAE